MTSRRIAWRQDQDLQAQLDRALRVIRFASCVAIIAFIALVCLLVSGARASELPCPPKHYFCWEVKAAVAAIDAQEAREHAKKCGWSEARIAAAEKCLR